MLKNDLGLGRKKGKGATNAHTSSSQKGLGDYYGTGFRNKIGKVIEGEGRNPLPNVKLKKPPKSLA